MKKFIISVLVMIAAFFISYGMTMGKNGIIQEASKVGNDNLKQTASNGDKNVNNASIKITISAAGDTTLGSDESFGKEYTFDAEFQKHSSDYGYFTQNVKSIFTNDDLTIVNLEGTLTNASKEADKEYKFKGNPIYVNILKDGGIDAVNLANNHSFDYGRQGFDDTVYTLKKAGIGFFGYGYKYIKEIKGIKVGILGYTGWSFPEDLKKQIKEDIQDMKRQTNLVIVCFHWGDEGKYYPNNTQIALGHYSVDEGADLVLGTHPHVIEGIEKYNGKYIVYSLGNFIFGGNRNPSDKDAFIFQQTFTFDNSKRLIDSNMNLIPISISSLKERNDFTPVILEDSEKERVLEKIADLSNGIK
ncbi:MULTISPECIES: CapA family protein [Thermoanaerobacterium]|uniref:Capsule synthesis protein, CapA n=1 Tax=Thermoanaerobacterium xylanolyticum (strain ATCC 49914 / DSM 7097 / LX-11) TaxID=858215 RepID=F6BJJ5_THEXL|nr:CapA family protein [Thermoanaerobacterium xylanolyticum]AEF17941.1 Capsule synthesis protein, CapA [Thermoanaerobacterium xylanolyticum LX-11]